MFPRVPGASAVWAFGAASAVLTVVVSCVPMPVGPDPTLLEAVEWYTGVAGRVDDARARRLLEEAVEDRDPISVMWLARVHSRGRMGFERDEDEARRLARSAVPAVQRAAESGVLEAIFLMGTAYDEGLGKEEDPVRAALWHARAAERGHVLAAHNLGNAYSTGRGVAQDPTQAVKWWTQAAEAGDAITQLRLGGAFENGLGTARDMEAAAAWYRRAAAAGNEQAREALGFLPGS